MPRGPSLPTVLEDLIDKHGVGTIMETMANICHEKAEHVAVNWQDNQMAGYWTRAGNQLSKSRATKAIWELRYIGF